MLAYSRIVVVTHTAKVLKFKQITTQDALTEVP